MKQQVLDILNAQKQVELDGASAKVEALFQPMIDAVSALVEADPVGGDVDALNAKIAELEAKLASVDSLAKQIDASIEDAPVA